MGFLTTLEKTVVSGQIPQKVYEICLQLYESYISSMEHAGFKKTEFIPLFVTLLDLIKHQVRSPYNFEPFHKKIVQPFDYYTFGIEFFRPLFVKDQSKLQGQQNIRKIVQQLEAGENAILFANHQTEVDPQLMSLILEDIAPKVGEEVIFVAGDRVLTDTLAVPFSMGRNLLCIYSKRHIDNPIEKKQEKLRHNQKTMQRMKELLGEGGKCIYVAPSGGRDRPDSHGEFVVAPFDPQSIEMFYLMAKQSKKSTHFYPLSLVTYPILPPPPFIELEVGEIRRANRDAVHFAFGDEIDMEVFPGADETDRHARRGARAEYIWNLVQDNYLALKQGSIS